MIKAVYSGGKDFYEMLKGLLKVTDNITLNFTEDGLISRHLTEDKVLMGIINIPKESFEEYTISQPIAIDLAIGDLKKVLSKAVSKSSAIELSETEEGLKMVIRDEKSGVRSNLYIKGNKGNVNLLNEPKVNLPVSFQIAGKHLKVILRDVSSIGDEVTIKAENDYIEFNTEGEGKVYKATLRKDKPLTDLTIEGSAQAIYSVEMLKTAVDGASFSGDIVVSFGTNMPLKIIAKATQGGYLGFWVAPRL